jgi:hypothetical protein
MGKECWWRFGRPAYLVTFAHRQPLPRYPLTCSARATGRCTTGSQRANMIQDGAVRDVPSSSYHDRWIGRASTEWPPRSPNFIFYLWGQLKALMYAAPVDNEEALHHRNVEACQTIRNYTGIFERMRRSMLRRVEESIDFPGRLFNCNSQYKCFRTLVNKEICSCFGNTCYQIKYNKYKL